MGLVSDADLAVKSHRPGSVGSHAAPLVYSCVSAAHPLTGVDVTEHALKCLLRLLLFSSIRLCMENRDEGALQKTC